MNLLEEDEAAVLPAGAGDAGVAAPPERLCLDEAVLMPLVSCGIFTAGYGNEIGTYKEQCALRTEKQAPSSLECRASRRQESCI